MHPNPLSRFQSGMLALLVSSSLGISQPEEHQPAPPVPAAPPALQPFAAGTPGGPGDAPAIPPNAGSPGLAGSGRSNARPEEVNESGKFTDFDKVPMGPPMSREDAEARIKEALKVEQVGPNKFQVGSVILDKSTRTVTIPAKVNKHEGQIEYALVTETGKVHEALFSTTAKPQDVHLACLLLGLPKEEDQTPDSKGAEVKVHVSWDTNGPSPLHELANLVVMSEDPDDHVKNKSLPPGAWLYVSSRLTSEGFAAVREGSIIAIITDPAALVVNPRKNAHRDDIHLPNQALLPPQGIPVRIILTIPPAQAKP